MPQTRIIFSVMVLAIVAALIYFYLPQIKAFFAPEPSIPAMFSNQMPQAAQPIQQSALPTPDDAPAPTPEPSTPPMGAINEALTAPASNQVPTSTMPPAVEIPLTGVEWVVKTMGKDDIKENAPYIVLQDDGRIVGKAGCNQFSGNYLLEGSGLNFPQGFMATKMMCGEASMATENAFLAALPTVSQWSIEDGVLSLIDNQGVVILRLSQIPKP